MNQQKCQFHILPGNLAPALEAIKALAGQETISDASGKHFSWVRTKDFLEADCLLQAMEAWRWHPALDDTGAVCGIEFEGKKMGDEDLLFAAIAPFVEKGSYIEMVGEDGAMWRWIFDGVQCREEAAVTSWESDLQAKMNDLREELWQTVF